tara:strand:+ start:8546 stop:9181 length:636 start_codon:yes stop_codon:yes gene_type:complete
MIKDHIEEVRNDLKSKRDALLIGHQNLKKDSDDWNKGIIIISLFGGLMESIKMRLELDGAGFALLPIIFSAITAAMSALIRFRNFNQRMETYLQSASLLTNTLLKARNHASLDEDLKIEYNQALEKIETALYPNERKVFLRQAHRNLIEIMSQEQKFYDKIDKVNNHEEIIIDSDDSSLSSDEKLDNTPARTNPINKDVLASLEEDDRENL